jgi:hypothetical protein
MKSIYFQLLLMALPGLACAQYAPQAGLAGSTAVSATSGQFEAWATGCTVLRGYQDIADPAGGYATLGDSSAAIGAADGGVVSLGDSGVADVTFARPIVNGTGPDFAVFENGFRNPADSTQAFLELGFVEVSSDGVHYFRFPATSLTQTNTQVGNGNYITASDLNNLAGKYIGGYGTPFDLDELAGTPGLDVNNVTHVRIIDVVGSIGAHAQHDHTGRAINDPYPTPFASSGFDLDAVGVLHQAFESVRQVGEHTALRLAPNPAADYVRVELGEPGREISVTITSVTGMLMDTHSTVTGGVISVQSYAPGMYLLTITDANGNKWRESFIRR